MVIGTVVLHLLASVGLLTGVWLREAALALAVFTVIATLKAHDFWNMNGEERLNRSRVALANLAIVGGLVLLATVGGGRFVL